MKSKTSKIDLDDIDLFKIEIGEVEHIEHDRIHPITNRPKPIPQFRQQRLDQDFNDTFSEDFEPHTVGSEETLHFRRSGIQKKLFSRLRNGHLHIEAELDLHGMTIPIAHDALAKFLHECHGYNIRCARIIHGKGWGSKQHKPVLKTKLNSWLQQDQNILAFCSAPIEDGGTGAVYILLRRLNKIR
ncbi:MAG: DNA mismatch repair protein MutS [Methylophaga sp.]|nr:MAG: DNA mismatch repair protein MutS [Methylophaga sp.]